MFFEPAYTSVSRALTTHDASDGDWIGFGLPNILAEITQERLRRFH